MGLELLASKISAASVDVSPRATWWPRHNQALARYLAVSGGRAVHGAKACREAAFDQCAEWDSWIPSWATKGAMRSHVEIEVALVEAARRNRAEAVEAAGARLIENAAEQAAEFGTKVASFPEDRFRRLVEAHVLLFTQHVRLTIEKASAKECAARAEANALALAGFTMEWF